MIRCLRFGIGERAAFVYGWRGMQPISGGMM